MHVTNVYVYVLRVRVCVYVYVCVLRVCGCVRVLCNLRAREGVCVCVGRCVCVCVSYCLPPSDSLCFSPSLSSVCVCMYVCA